ncbi:MAG: NAD(P)/FAD-dependent oxidoreductase [Muribaculum sp.]|nr:NAD(P)/FAD-dependent oxidoreductase [Muribaculum sp.]
MAQKEKIVVVGGGFAGLNLVKKLDRTRYEVVLVDKNNYHSFPPLFYQVTSAGLDPASISFPFRREMHKMKNHPEYHIGEVSRINTVEKKVVTQYETIHYDKLVLAAGTGNNFFGIKDLYKYVYTMKSTSEALRCRNEILDRLERASIEKDPEVRKKLLSFVVIGGGPAGVEVAGAIGEMKRYIMSREYPSINPEELQIILIEGSDKLLRTMSETASRYALDALKSLMVSIRLNKVMKSYEDNVITFADGSTIYSEMVIWTAGVTGITFTFEGREPEMSRGNRLAVDEYNRVQGVDDVFALGDISSHSDDRYPAGCPQLAQVAIQQARTLAKNLNRGEFADPFSYVDKGSMATIGRNRAVADLKHLKLTGWIAWMAWMFVHLMSILGMRNKLTVLVNWTWAYWSYPTSLRLMLHPARYPLRSRWGER